MKAEARIPIVVTALALLHPMFAEAKTAVVVVGDEARSAGALLHLLEDRLAAVVGFEVTSTRKLSARGAEIAPAVAETRAAAERAQERARRAFYDDRLADALEHLREAGAQLRSVSPFPRDELIRLCLWRTGVLLAADRMIEAKWAVRAALRLNPDLHVDLKEFWPSVAALVESARATVPTVNFRLRDLPPNATVRLDGELVAAATTAAVGEHHLSVRAPGYDSFDGDIELSTDAPLSLPLPIRLDAQRRRRILRALDSRQAAELSAIARRLANIVDANSLVFVAVRGNERQVAVFQSDRRVLFSPSFRAGKTVEPLIAWTLAALSSVRSKSVADKTTRAGRSLEGDFDVDVRGILLSTSELRLTQMNQTADHIAEGSGTQIFVSRRGQNWLARAGLGFTQFVGGRVRGDLLPAGASASIDGGAAITAELQIGYGLRRSRVALYGGAELEFHRRMLSDAEDASGPLGLFATMSRVGVGAFVSGRVNITARWSLGGEVMWELANAWLESPSDGMGQASAPVVRRFRLNAARQLSERWQLGLGFEMLISSAELVGADSRASLDYGEGLITAAVRRSL